MENIRPLLLYTGYYPCLFIIIIYIIYVECTLLLIRSFIIINWLF